MTSHPCSNVVRLIGVAMFVAALIFADDPDAFWTTDAIIFGITVFAFAPLICFWEKD